MGQVVIVAHQPKEGKAEELKDLLRSHVPRLKQEDLVTDRPPVIVQSSNGTIIEVFEWLTAEAIKRAHQNKAVHQMWAEFEAVCTYVPLNTPERSRRYVCRVYTDRVIISKQGFKIWP